jgi:hypothetical protein
LRSGDRSDEIVISNRTSRKRSSLLASVCEHPSAVWLKKLFGGRDVASSEEAGRVFLGCENDPRALCFAGWLGGSLDQIRRAADLGDAFAQACMAWETEAEECFRWAEISVGQGERDGFYALGDCYGDGIGCEEDAERARENYLAAYELGYVLATVSLAELLDKDDPQRFFWFGRAAANGRSSDFLHDER